MQVSPVDIQAWASDTGSDYPATPADKAAVLPIVAAWKAEQLADARANRGSNALAAPLMVAGGVGLGLAGLAAFKHFRQQGLSEPAAAQQAAAVEAEVKAVATAAAKAPSSAATAGSLREITEGDRNIRYRDSRYTGPRLRGDSDPTAAELQYNKNESEDPKAKARANKNKGVPLGSKAARAQGQYTARTEQGFHNPALAALDTPAKREAYLAGIADINGTDSKEFQDARRQIAAMEIQTSEGVDPYDFVSGLNAQERYGTTTAAEEIAAGRFLQQSRTKSNVSAQDGFMLRDQGIATSAKRSGAGGGARAALDALAQITGEEGEEAAEKIKKQIKWTIKDKKIDDVSPGEVAVRRALFDGPGLIGGIEQATGASLSPEDREWVQRSGRLWREQRGADGFPHFADELEARLGVKLDQGQRQFVRDAFAGNRELTLDEKGKTWLENLPKALTTSASPAPRGWGAGFAHDVHLNLIDPRKASHFFLDSDNVLRPYLGGTPHYGPSGEPLGYSRAPALPVFEFDENGKQIGIRYPKPGTTVDIDYTGRKRNGAPIAESDIVYLPTDDVDFYQRTDLRHPYLTLGEIASNASHKRNDAFAVGEDSGIKGMREPLNSVGSLFYKPTPEEKKRYGSAWNPQSETRFGVEGEDPSSRLLYGPNGAGEQVPLDLSFRLSELEAPAVFAGGRLRRALDDHLARTGQRITEGNTIILATDLARQHGVDAASVLRGAGFKSTTPEPQRTPHQQAHALGGGTGDQLNSIYRSLGMHAGADAWELESMVRSGDIRGAANALAPMLPALTQANGRFLRGASHDEKLNIVAEGLTAGLQDLATTLQKYPQMAEQFGIGKGAGGFGVDAYIKSYIRDWTTVRSLQLDPSGQPTYQVPADALELIAYEGSKSGRGTIDSIEDAIRGSRNGMEAALRIDRLVSAAQSTKEGDPNTNATSFAQTVFSMEDKDLLSTQLTSDAASDVRLSFATRRADDATKGFWGDNPSESLIDERLSEQMTDARVIQKAAKGKKLADQNERRLENAVLNARYSGADYQTPDGKARRADSLAAQAWINANSDSLEREREDLNRGILHSNGGPVSVGRGLVISSGERGAFLAGNTQGMHISYREELADDESTTPLDRAQDHAREATLNNQIDTNLDPTGPGLTDAPEAAPLQSEADRTAAEYNSGKLLFKNLGETPSFRQSLGAPMALTNETEQQIQERMRLTEERALLRGELDDAPSNAARWYGARAAEVLEKLQQRPWRSLVTGAPDANGVRQVQEVLHPDPDWQRGNPVQGNQHDVVPQDDSLWIAPGPKDELQHGTERMTGQWAPAVKKNPGLQVDTDQGPLSIAQLYQPNYRAERLAAGLPDVAPSGRGIDSYGTYGQKGMHSVARPPGNLYGQLEQEPRTAVTPIGSTETAARHRAALEARAVNGGEGFRDDQQLRDARTASENIYDSGELSGYGRPGSTFTQDPIRSEPFSAVPAAALEQLNTLRASMERPVPQADTYTDQELRDARARHIGDWISKAATPGFNKRGAQTSGWAGGDSWHGGARLAGREQDNIRPYTTPSDALVNTLAKLARQRAGAL